MSETNPDHRVYQSLPGDPNVVYTTPDSGQVHILYGGEGVPDGPGHGHQTYLINQDRLQTPRLPGER